MPANKLRFMFEAETSNQLNVVFKGSVVRLIHDYLRVHKHLTGEKIAPEKFLTGVISNVLSNDKAFRRVLRELNEQDQAADKTTDAHKD